MIYINYAKKKRRKKTNERNKKENGNNKNITNFVSISNNNRCSIIKFANM